MVVLAWFSKVFQTKILLQTIKQTDSCALSVYSNFHVCVCSLPPINPASLPVWLSTVNTRYPSDCRRRTSPFTSEWWVWLLGQCNLWLLIHRTVHWHLEKEWDDDICSIGHTLIFQNDSWSRKNSWLGKNGFTLYCVCAFLNRIVTMFITYSFNINICNSFVYVVSSQVRLDECWNTEASVELPSAACEQMFFFFIIF